MPTWGEIIDILFNVNVKNLKIHLIICTFCGKSEQFWKCCVQSNNLTFSIILNNQIKTCLPCWKILIFITQTQIPN